MAKKPTPSSDLKEVAQSQGDLWTPVIHVVHAIERAITNLKYDGVPNTAKAVGFKAEINCQDDQEIACIHLGGSEDGFSIKITRMDTDEIRLEIDEPYAYETTIFLHADRSSGTYPYFLVFKDIVKPIGDFIADELHFKPGTELNFEPGTENYSKFYQVYEASLDEIKEEANRNIGGQTLASGVNDSLKL